MHTCVYGVGIYGYVCMHGFESVCLSTCISMIYRYCVTPLVGGKEELPAGELAINKLEIPQ